MAAAHARHARGPQTRGPNKAAPTHRRHHRAVVARDHEQLLDDGIHVTGAPQVTKPTVVWLAATATATATTRARHSRRTIRAAIVRHLFDPFDLLRLLGGHAGVQR